jgi:predicted RNA-binding protein with PUA domain
VSEQETINVLSDTIPRQPLVEEYRRLLELKTHYSREYDNNLLQGPKNGKYLTDAGVIEASELTSTYRENILIIQYKLTLLKRFI